MDIRLAQKMTWENKLAQGFNTTNVPFEFCMLSREIAEVFDAWRKGRPEVADQLSETMIFLLGLAEMIGADLQDAVEAKLTQNAPGACERLPNGVMIQTGMAAQPGAVMNRGKLIRDRIPEIIRGKGEEPLTRVAETAEYGKLLRDKLVEEVEEFLASEGDPEELADILEVVMALADGLGIGQTRLEKLRANKAADRGAFSERIVWSGNVSIGTTVA
jgi:predicted house-cleaning noncanonical NTP pyrophosphatase (MazG superfamily)